MHSRNKLIVLTYRVNKSCFPPGGGNLIVLNSVVPKFIVFPARAPARPKNKWIVSTSRVNKSCFPPEGGNY